MFVNNINTDSNKEYYYQYKLFLNEYSTDYWGIYCV